MLRYLKFVILAHFGHARACLATPTQNMTINLWTSTYMRKIKTIARIIAEIFKICYFSTLWACQGMPGHVHPKYGNQPVALMDLYSQTNNQNNSSSHC